MGTSYSGSRSEAERLGAVVAARRKLHGFGLMVIALGTGAVLAILAVAGLGPIALAASAGVGLALLGLKIISYRHDQAADRRRIGELAGAPGQHPASAVASASLPERVLPLKARLDTALSGLRAAVTQIEDDNPAIVGALAEAQTQADKLLATIGQLDAVLARHDRAAVRSQVDELRARPAANADHRERLAALEDQLASLDDLQRQAERIEAQLALLADQVQALQLGLASQAGGTQSQGLADSLRRLQAEVKTGQELQALSERRLGTSQ